MTAMIQTTTAIPSRVVVPGVPIAGVQWPLYKVQALVIALVVAVLTVVVFASFEVTAWSTAIVLVVSWWVGRFRATRVAHHR